MCAGNNPYWYEYDLRQDNEIHQIAIQNQVPVKAGQHLPVEEKARDREGGYQQCRHIEWKQPGECLEIHRTYPDIHLVASTLYGGNQVNALKSTELIQTPINRVISDSRIPSVRNAGKSAITKPGSNRATEITTE